MNLKVSIIIPNYNHATYLQQRLDSVFSQTFQDFEVILLDDASTDNSLSILNKYKNHPKVSHFIVNKINSDSPFKQWKKGIELAKGEYIWIAESDDYCENTFLELLIPLFKKDIALVYSASNVINSNSKVLYKNYWANSLHLKRWEHNFTNNGINEIENYMRYRNCIPNASAVIFKKNAINANQLPINYKFCGDWKIWLQILKKGSVAYYFKPLNFFRKHDLTTRNAKYFKFEKLRFREYKEIINSESSTYSIFINRKKYNWIVDEWLKKSQNYSFMKKISMPMPFVLLIMYLICLLKSKCNA